MTSRGNTIEKIKPGWPEPGRQVALDTETTGLYPFEGDKIVSVGAVEISYGELTGSKFYRLINPNRPIPARVTKIH